MLFVSIFCSLLAYLIELSRSATTLPTSFINPVVLLETQLNITQNISLNNIAGTTYQSMEISDYFVSRLTQTGKLQIFDIDTFNLKFNIFAETKIPSSVVVTGYDFIDDSNQTLAIVTNENLGYLYNLYGNGSVNNFYTTQIVSVDINPRQNIQMVKDEFILLVTNFGKTGLSRRQKGWNWAVTFAVPSTFMTSAYNIKTCKANSNDTFFRVAIWKRNCFVIVFKCPLTAICTQEYSLNNSACTLSQYNSTTRDFYKFTFSNNCTKILFSSKNQGIRLVNLVSNSSSIVKLPLVDLSTPVSGFWFLDTFDQFIAVYNQNGNLQFYNVSSNTKIDTKTLPPSNIVSYSRLKKMIFVTDGEKLLSYKIGCFYPNYTFDSSGLCIFNASYVPPSPPTPPPSTNQNDTNNNTTSNPPTGNDTTSNPPTDNNTTQNPPVSNDPTQNPPNQTNNNTNDSSFNESDENAIKNSQKNLYEMMEKRIKQVLDQIENSTIKLWVNPITALIGTIYDELFKQVLSTNKTLSKQLNYVLQTLKPIAKTASQFVRTLPVLYLFLDFSNFWVIVIMYRFADLNIPGEIISILNNIYSYLNESLFQQTFQYSLYIPTPIIEKVHKVVYLQQLGFTSDFINRNSQTFLLLLVSYSLIALLFFVKSKLAEGGVVRQKLIQIQYSLVFSGQFVGIMNTFFLDLPFITENSYQQIFAQKLNIITKNFFCSFSMFFSCLIFILNSETSQKQKDRQEVNKKRLSWFFNSQCNCLLPIITMFRIIPIFFAFTTLFLCIPIYLAWKQQKLWFLALLKSSYLMIFNFGLMILNFSGLSQNNLIGFILSKFLIFVLLTGATHELFDLLVGLLVAIVSLACFVGKKITHMPDEEINPCEEPLPLKTSASLKSKHHQSDTRKLLMKFTKKVMFKRSQTIEQKTKTMKYFGSPPSSEHFGGTELNNQENMPQIRRQMQMRSTTVILGRSGKKLTLKNDKQSAQRLNMTSSALAMHPTRKHIDIFEKDRESQNDPHHDLEHLRFERNTTRAISSTWKLKRGLVKSKTQCFEP